MPFWKKWQKSDRTQFFFWNGLIEAKNWWKAPYRIVYIPIQSRVEKNMTQIFDFWDFVSRNLTIYNRNIFFPRSVRIDFSRSVTSNLFQRDLQGEIRSFTRNLNGFFFFATTFTDENVKILHKPTFYKSKKIIRPHIGRKSNFLHETGHEKVFGKEKWRGILNFRIFFRIFQA